MNIIKRVKTSLFFALSADRLNKEFLQFVGMHLTYLLSTSITMVFVNTLLMRVSIDPNVTLKYNIVHFVFVGLSMATAAIFMRKFNNKVIVIIGITLSMCVYLMTFIFMESLDTVYIIVAIIHGVATGFYWITYFNSLLIYSNDDTRDIAMSFLGVFAGIISLIMPMISGYAIQAFSGFTGYYIVFGICFAVAGLAVYLTLKMSVIEPIKEKTKFRHLLKLIYTKKVWFFVMHMDFFKGIREGAFSFFLNVLLFEIVQNEGLVGFNTFLIGLVSMASSIVAGKVMRPHNRLKFMLVSTTVMTIIVSILFVNLSAITILMLSVCNAFFSIFLVNPTTTTLYTVLDKVAGAKTISTEVIGTTECYKNAGRIVGILLILFLPKTNFFYVLSLMILTSTQYITTIFAKITLNCVKASVKANEIENK